MKLNIMTATGQLGRSVVNALLEQGANPEDLIASVRTPSKAEDFAAQGITVRQADYEDIETLKSAFSDTEILLLIPTKALAEPRILQHARALEAAQAAGVKRVLFSSLTSAVPGSKFLISPFMLYAEAKLQLSGMDWTILRNNMYLDPVAEWLPELIEMGHLPYPVKQGRIAYITRDDIARATAAAMLNSGHSKHIYELTGPYAITMPELAATISKVTGHKVVFKNATEEDYAEACRTGVELVPEFFIKLLTTIYRAVDNGEFGTVSDHVERLTGKPALPIETYLRQRWEEMQ